MKCKHLHFRDLKWSFAFVFLIFFYFPSHGNLNKEKAPEKRNSKLIDQLKNRFSKETHSEQSALKSLFKVHKKIKNVSKRKNRLLDRYYLAEVKAKGLSSDIVLLMSQVKSQKKSISHQLKFMYRLGKSEVPRILFSSLSLVELKKNLKYLNVLSKHGYKKLQRLEHSLKLVKRKKIRLKKQIVKILKIKGSIKDEESELMKVQLERKKQLGEIQGNKQAYLEKIKGVRGNLDSTKAQQMEFFEHKGNLSQPIKGFVSRDFGLDYFSEYRYELRHKGLFYSSEKGTEVISIYSGQVKFIGSISGYGNVLILSHGYDYYSVYGFLKDVKLKKGDYVIRDSILGKSGYSQRENRDGIYFEIRHFSNALDPKKWMKAKES